MRTRFEQRVVARHDLARLDGTGDVHLGQAEAVSQFPLAQTAPAQPRASPSAPARISSGRPLPAAAV